MSITRKLLKGMGLTEEQQETIMEAHLETVNGLKSDVDRYRADAETLTSVQKELDTLKAAGDGGLSELQGQYNALKKERDKLSKEYEQYKADQAAKEALSAKEKAYRAVLKELNISEKRMDTVVRAAHAEGTITELELDENGGIKGVDKLKEAIKADWDDFIVTKTTQGADIAHPPAMTSGNTHTMTIEEIDKIQNTVERQAAMAQNLDLYGIQ